MEEIKLASVKFKSASKIYYFSTNLKLKKDDRVVVETARGLELGEISQELKDISEFNLDTELKKIVRKATKKDIDNYQKNVKDAKQALVTCKEIVSRYDVNMQLTNCEYTLDKAKVIFMYTSDDRVDFRELLKELAVVFKCRIELRQIGPRDKAKVISGIGLPASFLLFLAHFLCQSNVLPGIVPSKHLVRMIKKTISYELFQNSLLNFRIFYMMHLPFLYTIRNRQPPSWRLVVSESAPS